MKALFPLFPLALLSIFACKRGPGSSCDAHEARCLDDRRAIVCDDGKFVETPCKGKGGCATDPQLQRTSCDISGDQPGDACSKSGEGTAVCQGEQAMLSCRGGKYESVPCRGPKGCQMLGEQASCDQSVAEAGEACGKVNAKACSADSSQVLSCQDGRMASLYFCRGESHCSAAAGKLACDQTLALPGDTCDKALSGSTACSIDKKSLLTCQNERFGSAEKCRPGTACTVTGQSTKCEKP